MLLVFPAGKTEAQKFAQKTNLLYWLTTTPNIGSEFTLHYNWTADLSVAYNPWSFPDNASLRHWLLRAEPRYWFWKPFMGHFLGVHGTYAQYNIGNIPFIPDLDEHTYKGNMYGGGLTYGYHIVSKGSWGVELSLSVGYLQLNYDKYLCSECLEKTGSFKRSYFGPTRIGISLVYIIR